MDCTSVDKIATIRVAVCLWILWRREAVSWDVHHSEICDVKKWPETNTIGCCMLKHLQLQTTVPWDLPTVLIINTCLQCQENKGDFYSANQ